MGLTARRHSRRRFLSRSALLAAAAVAPGSLLGASAQRERRRVILDVDLGIDDATALLFAHYSSVIDLLGVTTVFGNTTLEKGTRNSLYIKEKFGIEAEVYAGAAAPLYHPPKPIPTYVHGEDGLGDVEERIAPAIEAAELSAPEFIARTILEDPGEVTVIAVGPYTNLMVARLLEPAIVGQVRDVVIMGGAAGFAGELGNATTVGEANAINDPHAMSALFRYDWPVTMVGLDVTYTADASMDPTYLRRLAEEAGEAGAFLERINRFYMGFYERSRGVRTTFQHDSIAVAYAIAPELFETRRGKVRVITEGVAKGQTIFCPVGHHTFEDPEWAGLPTHTVCSKLDGPGFRELYRRTLVEGVRRAV
jgi:inosine-uridine nucleoside N-ribohydrolase